MRITLAVLFLLMFSGMGKAQQVACGHPDAIKASIFARYGEIVAATGAMNNGNGWVLLLNPKTGTFTQIAIDPRTGIACLMATGQGFTLADGKTPAKGTGL